MDTIIAIGIIAVAGVFVFRRVRAQMKAKKGGGCGCSGDCGPECASKIPHGCGREQEKECMNNKEDA
ncbi:MAG: hypothetical protein V3571_14465 [Pseudodesulfovibrio sp.]